MANTYIQVYVHVVFGVKYRKHLITSELNRRLAKYSNGILSKRNHIPVAAFYMPDHAHVLFGLNPNETLSSTMRDLKASTSKLMNQVSRNSERFEWQTGYGAFACSRRDLNTVAAYVNNQEAHHLTKF